MHRPNTPTGEHGYTEPHTVYVDGGESVSFERPTPTGEPQYDPTLEVPPEIMEMAYKIAAWATTQGWKHWEIGPVADRAALTAEQDALHRLAMRVLQSDFYQQAKDETDNALALTKVKL